MTNLTEKLRAGGFPMQSCALPGRFVACGRGSCQCDAELMNAAADEIDAIRHEIDGLRKVLTNELEAYGNSQTEDTAEPQADAAELADALDHIARVCRASRTQTRRIRWIEMRANCALGKGGDWRDAEVPKNSGPDLHYLQRENNRLSAKLGRYRDALERIIEAWDDDGESTHSPAYIAEEALRDERSEPA